MVLGSLSLLGGGGQEWELPPHQSLATFGSRTFLSIFLPFTPRGLSLKGALWLTQLPAPTPLPLGPLVYLNSRPTPDAAQTTLGFASHGSGEMRAGHLTPLCACPWLWVALLRGWRLGIPLPLEKGQALHLVQAGCWG